jgi:hypothetical protein
MTVLDCAEDWRCLRVLSRAEATIQAGKDAGI